MDNALILIVMFAGLFAIFGIAELFVQIWVKRQQRKNKSPFFDYRV
jgi:uncharacterized membrane protein HdeD (DUF308 family)